MPLQLIEVPSKQHDDLDYHALNAMLNLYDENGNLQLDADRRAARQYFLQNINNNTVFFHSLEEKLDYLFTEGYYEKAVFDQYDSDFVKDLFKQAYAHKFRFKTFLGAFKFYTAYALKTFDGKRYLERYEDRIVTVALGLAQGDEAQARTYVDEIITGHFQPATPTFLNMGKMARGELVSCFPAGTPVLTSKGYVDIAKIEVGDKVVTDNGETHVVEGLTGRSATDDGAVIRYVGGSFTATDEHPILIRTERTDFDAPLRGDGDDPDKKIVWACAKDVRPGDLVLFPRAVRILDFVVDGTIVSDTHIGYRVTEVQTGNLLGKAVYNLEVHDRHTYIVNSAIVHNCYLLRMEDNMESISRGITSALQLSKRGGGVSLLLTNLREHGAPIKKIAGASSGVIPVMKILEDSFSYANQLGARQGAGAVVLHAHHPDILSFLDTKRENADEKIRIKTLSLGVVIPDITFELAKNNDDMYLFSPYDVERVYGKAFSDINVSDVYHDMVADARIKKFKINARQFFQTLAELQFESGYPYIMFEDTVNRANPIEGKIVQSNLCHEITQVSTPSTYKSDLTFTEVGQDISCNLGSMNIALAMAGGNLGLTVNSAIRALTSVSEQSKNEAVPTIAKANDTGHSIGLGQMNLAGFFGQEQMHYGSPESIEFTSVYFAAVAYHAIAASHELAVERGKPFEGFEKSTYANGKYFEKYVTRDWLPTIPKVAEIFDKYGIELPTRQDWAALAEAVKRDGIYNRYLQAVPPTGSISYINNSTSSIHPVVAPIEIRKEGKIGRVYYPAPGMTQENLEYFKDAYEIGYEKLIDVYAAATEHIDQSLSLTLFFKDTATTRDVNKAQIYAWRKGIKTLYYIRLRQQALEGTEVEACVSCTL